MPPTLNPPRANRKGRILLVDDDRVVRMIVELSLKKAGFAVTTAVGAPDALSLLESGAQFDALISDYLMQGMTGSALLAYARTLHPNIPCMIITGFGEGEDLGNLPPGVIAVSKPIRRDELLFILDKIMMN